MGVSGKKVGVGEGGGGRGGLWRERERGWFGVVVEMSLFKEIKRER